MLLQLFVFVSDESLYTYDLSVGIPVPYRQKISVSGALGNLNKREFVNALEHRSRLLIIWKVVIECHIYLVSSGFDQYL